ncbi:hypothetical protein [Parapedobacter soli]|uniref:hypothetical protein n=1 Tax=Parapedobacter soli TaxID=416955 RepID=UPI0021C87701|nr:hypothetical protein [Parapedobacter soli]
MSNGTPPRAGHRIPYCIDRTRDEPEASPTTPRDAGWGMPADYEQPISKRKNSCTQTGKDSVL